MPSYRFFLVGGNDRYLNVHVCDCSDDAAAIERGAQYVNGVDVEIWDRGRLVKRLSKKTAPGAQPTPSMQDIPPSNI